MGRPSRLSKSALMLSRYLTTLVMSISMVVQACGEVWTLSTIWRAIARRMGVRHMAVSPIAMEGIGIPIAAGAAEGAGAGIGAGEGATGAGAAGAGAAGA